MKKNIIILMILFLPFALTAQWVQVPNGMGNLFVHEITSNTNTIFAGTLTSGIYRSTNYGANWIQTSINNQSVPALTANGSTIFAGIAGGDFYRSTDNGLSWNSIHLFSQTVHTIAVSGNIVLVGTYSTGIYRSTDNGLTWNQSTVNNKNVYILKIDGNYVYAGTESFGVYRSTDLGVSWSQTALNDQFVQSLTVNGNHVFAGTTDPSFGLYKSSDYGVSWSQPVLSTRQIFALASNGSSIFAGTYQYGVYVSSDNGITWAQKLEGLPASAWICTLTILNNYLFAGTYTPGNGVWRRPLGELLGLNCISGVVPLSSKLYQNYPNPFNPMTNIKFDVPEIPEQSGSMNVVLKIYDVLGKEITTLVNEQMNPGTYEVNFDGTNYPSGIYYCRMSFGESATVNKMILLK